nr:hypothetical protein Iba_chr08eCG11220 [Ipomoea batatas]
MHCSPHSHQDTRSIPPSNTFNSFMWCSLILDTPLSAITTGRHTRPPSEAMYTQRCKSFTKMLTNSPILPALRSFLKALANHCGFMCLPRICPFNITKKESGL